jgi:hypothetical protein
MASFPLNQRYLSNDQCEDEHEHHFQVHRFVPSVFDMHKLMIVRPSFLLGEFSQVDFTKRDHVDIAVVSVVPMVFMAAMIHDNAKMCSLHRTIARVH